VEGHLAAEHLAERLALLVDRGALLDDPSRCLVEEQVCNGIPIRMALLYLLAGARAG